MHFIYKRRINVFIFLNIFPVCVDFASSDMTPVTVNKELKKEKKRKRPICLDELIITLNMKN